MALVDGDSAGADDVWLRAITDERCLKPDGTLHNRAFSGKRALGPPSDVTYSPKLDDRAHADFIAFGAADKFVIRDWLQDMLQIVRPDGLAAIEALRPPTGPL
jgi:hypothetical protein